jgi:hypothetical protein
MKNIMLLYRNLRFMHYSCQEVEEISLQNGDHLMPSKPSKVRLGQSIDRRI